MKCNKESDAVAIIRGGNTMLGKRPVLIRKWDDKFDFKRDILRVTPVWVRLLNLPTMFWGAKSLSSIESLFGIPLAADECTTKQSRASYARLLIEVDVSKPLPQSVFVEDEDGQLHDQAYYIE